VNETCPYCVARVNKQNGRGKTPPLDADAISAIGLQTRPFFFLPSKIL
jgi:hypothetical protein